MKAQKALQQEASKEKSGKAKLTVTAKKLKSIQEARAAKTDLSAIRMKLRKITKAAKDDVKRAKNLVLGRWRHAFSYKHFDFELRMGAKSELLAQKMAARSEKYLKRVISQER